MAPNAGKSRGQGKLIITKSPGFEVAEHKQKSQLHRMESRLQIPPK